MDLHSNGVRGSSQDMVVPPIVLGEELAHDNFGPSVEACVWALAIVAGAWLALRLYLKSRKHWGLWWDDRLLAISWVLIILSNTSTSVAVSFGWGKELYDIPLANTPRILLALLIAGVFSILGTTVSKTSFALTLLRISNGWVKCIVWFAIVTVNVVMGLSILFNWINCTPLQKNFNVFLPGSCWPKIILIRYNSFVAAYSGTVDILLALLPGKIIWKMNMNRKERFGAICAMSLGLFAGIISLAKIYALAGTFEANLDSSLQLTVLSIAETAVTIMASSIPILRALARNKAGPGGVKLFTLNVTEHLTIQQPDRQPDDGIRGASKTRRFSRRLFTLVRRPRKIRAPVLSSIVEAEEQSPTLPGHSMAIETSFV
ncbi:hypothetical protein F4777DRAFT_445975 [Nemania sp. FL0916]|nr:hypothetical protein F4777DRAFT_445975 [Nemania sp. FL0916]